MKLAKVCLALAVVTAPAALKPSAAVPQASVLIDVAVSTTQSERVPGLTAADFEVLVDGRPKPIETFAAPPGSIAVVLLLDVSASMAVYDDTDQLIGAFVDNLAAGDQAQVAAVANRIQLAPRFSRTKREVMADTRTVLSFKNDEKFGPSPLWDALDAAAGALESQAGRRGIIFVTDGRASGNRIGALSAIERAMLARVTVHVLTEARPIFIRQDRDSVARIRSGLMLQELAKLTGGEYVPEDIKPGEALPDAKPVIARFVKDLRAMYTIGVSPDGPAGSLHRIEVKVKRPNVTIRTRNAYRR
jgi:VWFA-related protein